MLGRLYAAEAYHSRGSLRYVVGGMQLKDEKIKANLTLLDLWCTMLENWGDAMKVYKEAIAEKSPVEETLTQMSKYLLRTWKTLPEMSVKVDTRVRLTVSITIEKQPFISVLIKRCSENMQQIYRKTPMPKCDFSKVAKQLF